MTVTVQMVGPSGTNSVLGKSGTSYVADANGVFTIIGGDIDALLNAGFYILKTGSHKVSINSPLPADLISIKAAATPANGAITIAAQPPHARKFQVRIVLGTPGTTNITAGTLTLVGVDTDGNAITEVVQLNQFGALSGTYTTVNAYASLTSGTVAGYTASGSGTGNTLGIGVSNDFGIPTIPGGQGLNMVLVKSTKITKVLGTSNVAADDVASTATVDKVARTVNPTTAPAANGLVDYEFTVAYGVGA